MLYILRLCLLAACVSPAFAAQELETDRPGLDYRQFPAIPPLPAKCEQACSEENECRAWTFAWPGKKAPQATCFLKKGVPDKKSDNCCISGIKKTPAPAPAKKSGGKQNQLSIPATPPASPNRPAQIEPLPPTQQEVILPAPSQQVISAKRSECQAFAQNAERQNQVNAALGCGLSGGQWAVSYDSYFAWCMQTTSASRIASTAARDRALDLCRQSTGQPQQPNEPAFGLPSTGQNDCRSYAERALAQADANQRMQCGFVGQEWARQLQWHADYCLANGTRAAQMLLEQRDRMLLRCQPSQANPSLQCRQFAELAVRDAREAIVLDCGFRGRRWATRRDVHERWCRSATLQQLQNERGIRLAALQRCRSEGGTRPNTTEPDTFEYRWVRKDRRGWASKWRNGSGPAACVHRADGCRCEGRNYCGTYRPGQSTFFWPQGCHLRPWRIQCEVRPR